MYAVLHRIFLVLSCSFSLSLPPLPHGRVAVCTVVLIVTLFARVCLPLSYATHTYTHTDTHTHIDTDTDTDTDTNTDFIYVIF